MTGWPGTGGLDGGVPTRSKGPSELCANCKMGARQPHMAPCGHVACWECWYLIRHGKVSWVPKNTCPQCGARARRRKLEKLYLA